MSTAWSAARVEFTRSGKVAQSLSEMGVEPQSLKGSYYEIADALYRDEQGWYVVAKPRSKSDSEGRLYFNFESDGKRIEWK